MALCIIYLLAAAAVTSALPAAQHDWTATPHARTLGYRSSPLCTRNTSATEIGVARAGGVLNQQAAAEANVRDDTATRAFSFASVKSADGQCLFIDPTAGDFRENLIPVQLKGCDGSANEKFDVITKGKHNDQPGSMLVVSAAVYSLLSHCVRLQKANRVDG